MAPEPSPPPAALRDPEQSPSGEGEHPSRQQTPGLLLDPVFRTRLLINLAFFVFLVLSQSVVWGSTSNPLWFPPAGLGLVLVVWFGWGGLFTASAALLFLRLAFPYQSTLVVPPLADVVLFAAELRVAWWFYHSLGKGSRRVNDPRSATTFLLIVPGAVAACAALARASFAPTDSFWQAVSYFWISHAVGYLAIAPLLLLLGTPWLARSGLIRPDPQEEMNWIDPADQVTWGDTIETIGLGLGALVLGLLLADSSLTHPAPRWQFWGILLLVVVWASLRQGLRGGSLAAAGAAFGALAITEGTGWGTAAFVSLQGHLLALCSTALLVGASSGWIRASEMRYRQVVGHIPVVLYSAQVRNPGLPGKSPQARILLVSAACKQVFGCPPAELLGEYDTWLQHVHLEDRELVTAAIAQLGRQQGAIHCEYRLNPDLLPAVSEPEHFHPPRTPLPHPVGISLPPQTVRDRWVRDTLAPSYDKEGRLLGWEGVVEDITTQRTLAQDLRRTTTMLHTLVANLPAGVFFVQGPMGMPMLVNTRARHLLGQREDPSVGITHLPRVYRLHKPDGTLYPWEELPVYKALHLGLTSMRDDIVIHRPDGRMVPLITWAAPIELGEGKTAAAVWVFEDLTSLHQAEAARLDSEARLRTIVETMAEGLIIQDQDGVIIECNPAACSILGLNRKQLLGQSWLCPEQGCVNEDGTPFPRDQHPDILCRKSRAPVRNVVMGIPVSAGTDDAGLRWILVSCMPVSTGQTNRPGFLNRTLITFADITASRQIQTDLQRVQRLEVAGRLASGFVHDFNNLLTVILGLSQIMQMRLEPGHPLISDLETIQAAAEEASRLTSQLLTFSKQRKTSLQPVDLNQIVERTLRMLESGLPEIIQVETSLSSVPVLVMADEGQLQQVVMNLCLNARDAMPQGGHLILKTGVERKPTTNDNPPASSEQEYTPFHKNWVRLRVQDTGHGIDKDIQAKIFDPFFSTKERGTGLGLAVVRHLVEGFHGHIELRSEPNQGTCFDIWLPLYAPERTEPSRN